MFRVVTRNSEYNVTAQADGFYVTRAADRWGRQVKDNHAHFTRFITIEVGAPFHTDSMTTSLVEAVLERERS